MSVITSNLSGATSLNLGSAQEMLSRSLARLAASSSSADSSAPLASADGSTQIDGASLQLQTASAGVQNDLTSAQTADGYLDGMSGILAQMKDLASLAQNGSASSADTAQYEQEFSALQDQLRSIIGGTSAEIGGSDTAATATFDGSDLFGPSADGTAGPTDLRQGPMLDLIAQDATGAYALDVSDSNAGANVAAASQQVDTGHAALEAKQAQLGLAAARLQVEQQNLFSIFSPISDASAAGQATQLATDNILGQSGGALAAQSNLSPATVLNLV